MHRTLWLLALLAVVVLAGAAMAEDKTEEAKELEPRDLFKAMCKVCHAEDSDAGEYTPMYLIIEQWEEFYDELYVETHEELTYEDGKNVVETITKEQLKEIRDFCIEGAADSEHPMTCG